MRESRTFAERTKVLKSDEATKKYFLVYEGSDTEVIYFDAIRSLREDIGINPLIELIPIIRSFSEEGWSNPKKILDRVIENLQESKDQSISYESLLNRIMDYLYEVKVITTSKVLAHNIWKTMHQACIEKIKKSLDDVVEDVECACNMLIEVLNEEYGIENIVEGISGIIKDGGLTYEEGFDQICLIVDRDKDSFVSDQYDYVLNKCKELKRRKVKRLSKEENEMPPNSQESGGLRLRKTKALSIRSCSQLHQFSDGFCRVDNRGCCKYRNSEYPSGGRWNVLAYLQFC